MSIRPEYIEYIEYFEKTETLQQYSIKKEACIALRHDVDHCIDTAMEMAFWESENNIKSTYFILHTAEYMNDPRILEKCKQIQSFGHEIGIHTNYLTQWYKNRIDPKVSLRNTLDEFRSAGLNVYGTSAHGDQACYKNNFINYWIFGELKPAKPSERESELNAEGIFERNESKRIIYPNDELLVNTIGDRYPLWGVSQKELGLVYEASHLPNDLYFSDSGGGWKRTPDPKNVDLKNKRVQVLIHPIHWKAPKRSYFFLSTARSGSKWLSTILNDASSCASKHEYTLNHFEPEDAQLAKDKMTGVNLHSLLGDGVKIQNAFNHTRKIIENESKDYAEVNVYLPLVLNKLTENFPNSTLVHLHRNPKDVVRSIMNRGWYDTPNDTSHPIVSDGWSKFTPFEKCCLYVKEINQLIIDEKNESISFEKMTTDNVYLKNKLKKLGIAYYPLLSKNIFEEKINVNKMNDYPNYSKWPLGEVKIFKKHCQSIQLELGYHLKSKTFHFLPKNLYYIFKDIFSNKRGSFYEFEMSNKFIFKKSIKNNCIVNKINDYYIEIKPVDNNRHSYLLMNGGGWNKLSEKSGWKLFSKGYYSVKIKCKLKEQAKVNIFCLYYDSNNDLIYKRPIGTIDSEMKVNNFSFAQMGKSKMFNLAVYIPKQDSKCTVVLENIDIKFIKYS